MNYYEILGIKNTDDIKTIKRAYKKLASMYHPDKNHGNVEFTEKFKKINEAYETLSNESKRSEYDASLNGFRGFGSFGKHSQSYDRTHDFKDIFDFDDIFAESLKRREREFKKDMENDFWKGYKKEQSKAEAKPLTATVSLTKDEVINGTIKDVIIAQTKEKIKVRFKPDSLPGRTLKTTLKNGSILHIKIKNFSTKWKFENDNVVVGLDFDKIEDKSKVEVKTINGKIISVRLPDSVKKGSTIRLKGQGWTFQNGTSTDLLLKLK